MWLLYFHNIKVCRISGVFQVKVIVIHFIIKQIKQYTETIKRGLVFLNHSSKLYWIR